MDVSTAVPKLRARASHALDLLIGLEEKHAMLRPLAFDRDLSQRVGGGPPGRGRVLLQNALLETCVRDLVKLSLGADRKAPSLQNIMKTLEHDDIQERLLQDYIVVPPAAQVGDSEPLPEDDWNQIVQSEQRRLEEEFRGAWILLWERWAAFVADERLQKFKTWRDKLIAHSDLHLSGGDYRLLDLTELDLKWGDLGELIGAARPVVDGVGTVVRSSSFAWEMLEEQVEEASSSFWALLRPNERETEQSN